MFYCDECDREIKEEETIFNYEDNSFKHTICGQIVEYCNKRQKENHETTKRNSR